MTLYGELKQVHTFAGTERTVTVKEFDSGNLICDCQSFQTECEHKKKVRAKQESEKGTG